MAKTKEIVFHRPHPKNLLLLTTLPGIERVLSTKVLRVWLQSDLGMGIHVDTIAQICKQRLYLLTQLKKQGLSQSLLKVVFEAIVISQISYMAPAWRGYSSRADIDLIQELFVKARRWEL